MKLLEFIELCKRTPEIPYDNSLTHHQVIHKETSVMEIVSEGAFIDELKRCINHDTDPDNTSVNKEEMAKFMKGLVYVRIIENNPDADLAIAILATMRGLIGNIIDHYRQFEHPLWEKAVGLLKGYLTHDSSLSESMFPDKAADRAKSAIKLREFGVSVSVDGYDICFDNADKVFTHIDERVSNMGGRWWIDHMLAPLEYNKEMGRLILPKRGNTSDPTKKPKPDFPFNYMLNVGLKNLSSEGNVICQNKTYFYETVRLFSDVCFAMFEVQTYNIWENVFHQDKNPIEYVRDLVYRESIFDLHQSSMRFTYRLLDGMPRHFSGSLHHIVNDFIRFLTHVLGMGDAHSFVELRMGDLRKHRFGTLTIDDLLRFTSKDAEKFNEGFSSPTDYEHVDFWDRPIVKTSEGKYYLLPQTIAARGCIESFFSWIRVIDTNFDGNFGYIIENYLTCEFRKKGIEIKKGRYELTIQRDGHNETEYGECDGLIESGKSIILLELKKKSLVRASRGGSESNVLIDLKSSLVDSQVQGLRTQYALKNGPLTLNDNGHIATIEQNDRKVERLTVTLFPFGDIQDRTLVEQILEIMCRHKFEYRADDESKLSDEERVKAKRLKDMGKKQDRLIEYLNLLNEERPFFNSWFLDVEKIVWLLRDSYGPDEFASKLLIYKYVTTGTFDLYNEHLNLRQMQ